VVVEHGEHGSGAAAPIAKELIKTYLRGNQAKRHMVKSPERILEGNSG
jgi:cell division protein FtsI/penicillin-binding protein 2